MERLKNTRFSVIIPTFEAESTIDRCIESILGQSHAEFEILIIDDASADGTRDRVAAFEDPRIRFIAKDVNGGPADCRNIGLDEATGEFIVFVDADDWLDPEFLSSVAKKLNGRSDLDYVITRYRLVGAQGAVMDAQSPNLEKPLETFLHDRIVSSVWAKAFKADPIRLQRIRFPAIRYMEDSAFNVRFLLSTSGAAFAEEAVYNYSKLQSSATTRPFDAATIEQIERGLWETQKVLAEAAYHRPDLADARAIRMLLLQGIFRLVADYHSGSSLSFATVFRKQMANQFSFASILRQPELRLRDKTLIMGFYAAPRLAIKLLAWVRG